MLDQATWDERVMIVQAGASSVNANTSPSSSIILSVPKYFINSTLKAQVDSCKIDNMKSSNFV